MSIRANKMNRVLSMLVICLCLGLVIVGFGCKKQSEPPAAPSDANSAVATPTDTEPETTTPEPTASITTQVPTPAPTANPNAVAVTVNGEVIREGEISAIIDRNLQQNLQRMPGNVPAEQIAKFKEQMKPRVLEDLIVQKVLDQQVAAAHVEVTDEDVTKAMTERLASFDPNMTVEKYKEVVESQGGNFDEAMGQFKQNMARQEFIESQWAGKVDVNDQDVKTYYDEHPAEFKTAEQVQASHILIKPDVSDPNTDPNDAKAAARTKIEGLLAQIKDGADFAELAKANSDCPSAAKGGDLGAFERGRMVKPFSDAAFAMEPNQVSDIVETRFGYHIIKVTGRTPEETVSFEDAKDGIKANLENQKKRTFVQDFLKSLKDNATIVYPEKEAAVAPMPTPPTMAVPVTPEAPAATSAPAPADANE